MADNPKDRLPLALRQAPALTALLIQLAAWVLALSILPWITPEPLPMPGAALLQGALAGAMAWWAGQPVWWLVIHPLFFPALWATQQLAISPGWFLAGFLLLGLTSLGVLRTRVPLYLSSPQAADHLADLLPATPGLTLVDLGCGLGGPLARLSRRRPELSLRGVEAAPLNWLVSRLRLNGRARVRLGSLWDEDLAACDAVYAYLSPAPMARLWDKARQEMRPGSLFISNTFAVPGVEPDRIIELNDRSRARLMLWRMP